MPTSLEPAVPAMPWWRYRILWLVIALPALSVAAGFGILGAALNGRDAVLGESDSARAPGSQAPALKARNHAQTGVR